MYIEGRNINDSVYGSIHLSNDCPALVKQRVQGAFKTIDGLWLEMEASSLKTCSSSITLPAQLDFLLRAEVLIVIYLSIHPSIAKWGYVGYVSLTEF